MAGGRSGYGCAAVFSVLHDQQEDAGHYERYKAELKALLKEKIMVNAQRNLDSLRELPPVDAWGADRAPPALDTAAKLANVQWPVSSLFPLETGAERVLGHRAPPAELEDRTVFFIKQLFADTANLYSAEEYKYAVSANNCLMKKSVLSSSPAGGARWP